MSFFEWNDCYSVHIDEIDRQHRELIGMINELHESVVRNRDENSIVSAIDELDTMSIVLDKLIEYAGYHFDTEERYMIEYEYPEYHRHKEEHHKLTERIEKLKWDFDNGQAVLSADITQFLKEWLSEHILGVDKQYGLFLRNKIRTFSTTDVVHD